MHDDVASCLSPMEGDICKPIRQGTARSFPALSILHSQDTPNTEVNHLQHTQSLDRLSIHYLQFYKLATNLQKGYQVAYCRYYESPQLQAFSRLLSKRAKYCHAYLHAHLRRI